MLPETGEEKKQQQPVVREEDEREGEDENREGEEEKDNGEEKQRVEPPSKEDLMRDYVTGDSKDKEEDKVNKRYNSNSSFAC